MAEIEPIEIIENKSEIIEDKPIDKTKIKNIKKVVEEYTSEPIEKMIKEKC